jgi:signal transduction histidine kinase
VRLRFSSMRARTTAGFVLIIALILGCFITTLLTFSERGAEYDNRQTLNKIADLSRADMQAPNWKDKLLARLQAPAFRDQHIVLMLASREEGVVWKSEPNTPPWPPNRDNPRDDQWKVAVRPVGERRLIVARPWAGVLRDREAKKLDMLFMAGFILLAVGAGGWLVVGRTLSPIRKLAKQASTASAEHLNLQLSSPSNDVEVVDLVETLNDLLSRISETAESKGRFYAAASHELRTPLQALSGHLELALSRERPAQDYRSALEEAQKQSNRLKSLVQSLLLLHQLENSSAQVGEEVDLTGACMQAISQMRGLVAARQLQLSEQIAESIVAEGIPNHAEMLLRNLVENAVKYASPQGEVRVALTTNGVTTFEVFNTCDPVPGWNSDKVFEAFYRPDPARNANTGGNGLGLAICRAIANANGWDLQVTQEPDGVLARVAFEKKRIKKAKHGRRTGSVRAEANAPLQA